MEPRQVLDVADSESQEFVGNGQPLYVVFDTHAGGSWILEARSMNGVWVNAGPDPSPFSSTGLWWIRTGYGVRYRLSGGSVGARAQVGT